MTAAKYAMERKRKDGKNIQLPYLAHATAESLGPAQMRSGGRQLKVGIVEDTKSFKIVLGTAFCNIELLR